MGLQTQRMNAPLLRKRYTSLPVPPDVVTASPLWGALFPPHRSFTLPPPAPFHVMHRDVARLVANDAKLLPEDADDDFSAKVIKLSVAYIMACNNY